MKISWKPYSEIEYIKFGTYNFEMVKVSAFLGKILRNKNEFKPETVKILRMQIDHIMHFYFYERANQYLE